MQRTYATQPTLRFAPGAAGAWLARRWYYTPQSRRAYSVRQIAPGDRRLLAEFTITLQTGADPASESALTRILMESVNGACPTETAGYVALESTAAGDRVIGVAVYSPGASDGADFAVAVAPNYRDEQLGRNLLNALVRHARHVGLARLSADMNWSNRPMRSLAGAVGFECTTHPRDRNLRRLTLQLK
jgi:GNAT superfamily N-acetyltransferase